MRGDDKAHRTHQMRRGPQPDVTLGQRRTDTEKRSALQHGEAEDAAAPRSPCSSRITRKPRPAASRATLTPFKPPPMIARS